MKKLPTGANVALAIIVAAFLVYLLLNVLHIATPV